MERAHVEYNGSGLSHEMTANGPATSQETQVAVVGAVSEHDTLKYHLLGPSLTKAGQDSVDQQKVLLDYAFEATIRTN